MRKLATLATAIIVCLPLGLAGQDETFYPYSYARLSYVNGDVYIQRASDLGYEKGEVNLALVQGDKMGTDQGQAEVHFGRRNYLRLDENTRVEFAFLPREGEEFIKIHLLEGRAYLRVSALIEDKGIEVHTPDASFYVLEEGLFRFDVGPDRMTEAFVHEGSLEAASEDGSVMVRSLESVSAADGRLLGDPDYFYSREDAFDAWNVSRDSLLARRTDRRYLPQELDAYEEELSDNGNWVYERPYGYVWVPVVHESAWRPYHYGRWVWYPVIGWTWVSSEPWGWAVYHYGRWHWRVGLGWYWIPHHHWRPAWVHWWWGADHIGWCPLGWYNRPIVVVNNFFYDRHFDAYFPAHNRALTVVHRRQLQAPQVHRHQLGQAELGRISKVALKAQAPTVRPAVNSAGPQAVAAKKVLASRLGERAGPKNIPASQSLSPSGATLRGGRTGAKTPARVTGTSVTTLRRTSPPEAGAARREGLSTGSENRSIRSYPSRPAAGLRQQSGTTEKRPPTMRRPDAGTGTGPGKSPARVSPTVRQSPPASKTSSEGPAAKIKKNDGAASSTAVKKSGTIKNYPSARASASSSRAARPSTSASFSASRTTRPTAGYPSRVDQGVSSGASRSSSLSNRLSVSSRSSAASPSRSGRSPAVSGRSAAPRSSPAVTAPSSRRPASSSYARPGASRSSAPARPRSSVSSPSRSGGPSVRSSGGSGPKASSARSSSSSSSRSSRASGSVKKKDS